MREHPKYPGLLIREGFHGERPMPGCFYQPKKGDTLSGIGSKAGIPWRKINQHPWNLMFVMEYRKSSSNCNSKKVVGVDRAHGYISLCPSTGYGVFQIIWIPDHTGLGPSETLEQQRNPVDEASGIPKRALLNQGVSFASGRAPLLKAAASPTLQEEGEFSVEPERKMPWGAIALVVGVTTAMVVFLPSGKA